MKKVLNIILFAAVVSTTYFPFESLARDPFAPFASSDEKKDQVAASDGASAPVVERSARPTSIAISNPLVTAPLQNYRLAAVMLTPREAYAVLKAPSGIQYIAQKDDKVGNEGGRITEITIKDIKVKSGEEEVRIPVSNFAEAISVEEKEITP